MPHNHFERLARQFAVNTIHQKQYKQYKQYTQYKQYKMMLL